MLISAAELLCLTNIAVVERQLGHILASGGDYEGMREDGWGARARESIVTQRCCFCWCWLPPPRDESFLSLSLSLSLCYNCDGVRGDWLVYRRNNAQSRSLKYGWETQTKIYIRAHIWPCFHLSLSLRSISYIQRVKVRNDTDDTQQQALWQGLTNVYTLHTPLSLIPTHTLKKKRFSTLIPFHPFLFYT
jgi:hypothetical protein